MELLDLTITDATMLIEQSKLSPLELTRAYLERIEKLDPLLHCFIIVSTESALQSAEKAENAIQRGPLHGIPIALKDMFETKGVRTKACALGSGCV